MNVEDRLHLSGRNLLGCLSRDDGYLPYWQMAVDEELRAMYQFRPYCSGHNVGRWWNTMLRLERAAGFEIPAEMEAAMLENSWRLADNASGIFLEDVDPRDPPPGTSTPTARPCCRTDCSSSAAAATAPANAAGGPSRECVMRAET